MWNITNILSRTVFAFLLLIALPSAAISQSIWLPPSERSSISLEVFKIDLVIDKNIAFATSTWFLTGRYQKSESITIVGELPMSRVDFNSTGFLNLEDESVIGNPYIGYLFNSNNSGLTGEIGVRIPIVSLNDSSALLNGIYSDIDRSEAFIPDYVFVRARLGNNYLSRSGNVHASIKSGGTLWASTEGEDSEIIANLIAQIWLKADKIMMGATFVGRSVLTEPDLSFKERSEFLLGFGASATFGNVRPGISVNLPLGDDGFLDYGTLVDAVFRINLSILLGQPKSNGGY